MGRLQINGFDRDAHSFINLLKNWSSSPVSGDNYPADLNADGYPTTAPSTRISGTINPFPTGYTGHLVLKWTGTGALNLQGGATIHDGAEFVSGGTGTQILAVGTDVRIEFSFTSPATPLTVFFPTTAEGASAGYTSMANAVLCRVEDEAALDGGAIFNPDFLDFIEELNPSILRLLSWCSPNDDCNVTNDDYAPSAAVFAYGNNRWHPDLWAGDASGTDTYSVGAAPDTPVTWTDKEIIQCRIPNANTSTTVTLDVDGRGAKRVKTMFVADPAVGAIATNQLATFIYDAKSDFLLYNRSNKGGLYTRVPLSVQVALANETGKDLWITLPHLLNDASVEARAEYIKANLDPSLTVYVELSNEIWNFGGGFAQTSYANIVGRDFIGFPDNNNRPFYGWYAMRARQVLGIFTDVWDGATSPTLKRVLAFQAFGPTSGTNTYRLQGADLTLDVDGNYTTTAEDIVTNYTQAPNRPIDYCDVLSYATYYSGHQSFAFDASYSAINFDDLRDAADDYDSGDPALMAAALDWLDADLRGSSAAAQTLKKLNDDIYPAWETIAASHGKDVLAYEGGMEIAAPSTSRLTALSIDTAYSAKIDTLFDAYKENWRFEVLASAQWRQFMAQASAHTPSWFVAIGTSQWSLRQGDIYEEATWKSWDAAVARLSGKEVFSLRLTAA